MISADTQRYRHGNCKVTLGPAGRAQKFFTEQEKDLVMARHIPPLEKLRKT